MAQDIGFVSRISGKDKEEVEVQLRTGIVRVKNMLDLHVGEYVVINDGLIIERISEHEAERRLKR